MRIIRSSAYRRMPWKNGGGETVEIVIAPAGATLDAFDWRVSMARVASSGPFSRFPGIDRTLAVLTGAGIRLDVAGRGAVTLERTTPPFAFSGDDPAAAELVDGPIEDLNVMTQRTRYRHRLSRISATAPVHLPREGEILVAITRGAAGTAIADGEALDIADGDTLLLDHGAAKALEIAPAASAELYLIELWRV
jgi:uncharacterized protein